MSLADEFSTFAKEAEEKAKAASDPVDKLLWEILADEWRLAKKSQLEAPDRSSKQRVRTSRR